MKRRPICKAMKKVGASKCYQTGRRCMTATTEEFFDASDPRWRHAPFDELILALPTMGVIIPPEWKEITP